MQDITLIGTYHAEKGDCNPNELYTIIESYNPKIIFEGIYLVNYNRYYVDSLGSRLETNTIIEYLYSHDVEHIPVDYVGRPPPFFLKLHEFMQKMIEQRSIGCRKAIDLNSLCIGLYGFKYLNSINHRELNNWINNEIAETLKCINDEEFIKINKKWLEFTDNRENVMISHIYDYCTEHNFERGLFYIDAIHRSSILPKIQKYNELSEIKLNWDYFDYGELPFSYRE